MSGALDIILDRLAALSALDERAAERFREIAQEMRASLEELTRKWCERAEAEP